MKQVNSEITIEGFKLNVIESPLTISDLNIITNTDDFTVTYQLVLPKISKEQLDDMKYFGCMSNGKIRQTIIDNYMEHINLFLTEKIGL